MQAAETRHTKPANLQQDIVREGETVNKRAEKAKNIARAHLLLLELGEQVPTSWCACATEKAAKRHCAALGITVHVRACARRSLRWIEGFGWALSSTRASVRSGSMYISLVWRGPKSPVRQQPGSDADELQRHRRHRPGCDRAPTSNPHGCTARLHFSLREGEAESDDRRLQTSHTRPPVRSLICSRV